MKFFRESKVRVSSDQMRALDARCRTYRALSRLLADAPESPQELVMVAASAPCAWVGKSFLESAELGVAAFAARATCGEPTITRVELQKERRRLYGDPKAGAADALVPTCESTYRDRPPHADQETIEAAYAEIGYSYRPEVAGRPCCAGHISTELAFMAFALEQQMDGVRKAKDAADEFFTRHVAVWATGFAETLRRHAQNDVLSFSAYALELFVQSEMALVNRPNSARLRTAV